MIQEEDLILGEPEDGVSVQSPEEEGEFEFDTTEPADYVNMAMTVLSTLESVDKAIMSKAAAKRIDQMRYWAGRIAWYNLKEIYDLTFDEDTE